MRKVKTCISDCRASNGSGNISRTVIKGKLVLAVFLYHCKHVKMWDFWFGLLKRFELSIILLRYPLK